MSAAGAALREAAALRDERALEARRAHEAAALRGERAVRRRRGLEEGSGSADAAPASARQRLGGGAEQLEPLERPVPADAHRVTPDDALDGTGADDE